MNTFNQNIPKTFIILILCLLGILIYANTFQTPFQFDDKDFIVNNPDIRNLQDTKTIWKAIGHPARFVAFYTFALNYHFHKLDVIGYHIVNLLIHLINSILVFWFAFLTLGTPAVKDKPYTQDKVLIAFFSALIFLSHPIQTESVTYITQRFASLATLFYILSMCLYISGRLTKRGTGFYIGAVIAGVLGMFTKSITFTLPLAIILFDICFFQTDNKDKPINFKRYIPILGFLIIIPAIFSFKIPQIVMREYASRSHEGDQISVFTYLFTQFRVLVTYIRLMFVPLNQNFDYDYPVSSSIFEWPAYLSFIVLLFVFLFAIKIARRHRVIAFGIFWFFLTLAVESTIIVLPHVIFEHRLYLPLAGCSMMISLVIYSLSRSRSAFQSMMIIIILTLSILTVQRNRVWRDGVSLWSDVISKSPQKSRPYHNRGFHYLEKKEYLKALQDFDMTIRLNPKYLQAYSNRATAYRALGRIDLAVQDYNKAIELQPHNAQAYHNRAHAFASMGQVEKAFSDYSKALSLKRDHLLVYYNRGLLYKKLNQFDKAIDDFSKAIEIYPDFSYAHLERGRVYLAQNKLEAAINDFSAGLELQPHNVNGYNNRAVAFGRQKKYDLSIQDFSRAIEIAPESPSSYYNRSLVYQATDQFQKALDDVEKAEALGFSVGQEYKSGLRASKTKN